MPSVIKRIGYMRLSFAVTAIAILVFVSFELWRRSEAARLRSQRATLQTEAEIVMRSLASRVQNPETCAAALKGAILSAGKREPITVQLSGSELAAPSTLEDPNVLLKSLGVELDAKPDMRTKIEVGGVLTEYTRYQARLQAVFGSATEATLVVNRAGDYDAFGRLIRNLGIPFLVWIDSGGTLSACYGRQSAGAVCNDLGGYFIAGSESYTESCRLSMHTARLDRLGNPTHIGACRMGGTVSKAASCGGRFGYPFKDLKYHESDRRWRPAMGKSAFMCLECQ